MNKINSFLVSALAFTVLLTGCGEDEEVIPVDSLVEPSTEATYYSPTDIERTSAESVADGFMEAIKNADFSTALSLINITDGRYISPEDLEYVVRRSVIGFMINQPDTSLLSTNFIEKAGKAYYSFYTSEAYDMNSYYEISLELNESNEWCVSRQNFVKDSVLFYVPEGVRFYLNDIEITSDYKLRTENAVDIYRLPEVARRTFTTTIVSSIFGEISGELTVPAYDPANPVTVDEGEPIEVFREITPELFEELGTRVQYMYNQIYQMMDTETSAESLDQFITSEKNYKFLEQYYNRAIDARKGSYSLEENAGHAYTDVEILEFWQNPSVPSYVYSNDTIVVNMILSIRWLHGDNVESAKVSAGVKLTKTPGGDWLLNDITPGAWTNLISGLDESNGVDAW